MNWKAFTICAVLFGSAFTARASEPITYKEIAMLLRNGESQQFVLEDTSRRKLLQPLTPEEEQNLVVLGATPAFLNALKQPAMIVPPQAAAEYQAQVQQRAIKAQQEQQQEEQQQQEQLRRAQVGPSMTIPGEVRRPVMDEDRARDKADPTGKPLNLKFTAADGSSVDLASLRGKVVLIDFWATWCRPCMGEVPNVVAAYQKYHDKGFEIIGISLDSSRETMLSVTREKGMTWPQYFDGKVWKNAISSAYHIQGIPAMWLVDKQGRVATTEARGRLDMEIERLLAE